MNADKSFPFNRLFMMKELNVMLVDDDRIILDDIRSMINWEANGLRIVATAPNGKKAFELYRHYMPDIVITDIKMPIMDGMELVEKIRKISADTKIPVSYTHLMQSILYYSYG